MVASVSFQPMVLLAISAVSPIIFWPFTITDVTIKAVEQLVFFKLR